MSELTSFLFFQRIKKLMKQKNAVEIFYLDLSKGFDNVYLAILVGKKWRDMDY